MSQNKKYDLVVYIGRMQPPTRAHISIINKSFELGKKTLVLFGSSFQPRTIKNPWKWHERAAMVSSQIDKNNLSHINFRGIKDFPYNDQEWAYQVQTLVKREVIGIDKPKIALIGCKKDESSFYLNLFPQWTLESVEHMEDINATTVREEYFSGKLFSFHDKDLVSTGLSQWLREWSTTEMYQELVAEYEFFSMYKKQWENSPYPPTFVTADAIVIQSGHILMVKRRSSPGKGLWALPGGFLNQNETLKECAIRELKEETKLKIPDAVLRGSIIGEKLFDNPSRSLRGRTITNAFVISLPPGELAKVKGSDDAEKAKWLEIGDVLEMSELIFEDHSSLIEWGISLCGQSK